MKHVLWIGGPQAAGKTTIATRLARRFGLRLYSADTRTWVHRDRALREGNAAARRWEAMTPVQRWEESTVDEMVEMSLHSERGRMVIDDLRALPMAPLVVAEGSTLPPWTASTGDAERSRAVWLLPTAGFQQERLAATGISGGRARLYRRLRDVIESEARDHEVPVIVVDGSIGISGMVDEVAKLFSEAIAEGSCATTREERRRLAREMNMAIVEQVLGYCRRPWAEGVADTVPRAFVCECGDSDCQADVRAAVRDAVASPVRAQGHDDS